MRSFALIETEIPSPLYVTGKKRYIFFFALMVAVVAYPLCNDVVLVMLVRKVTFLNKR